MSLFRVNHRSFDLAQLAYDNANQYDGPDLFEDCDDDDFSDIPNIDDCDEPEDYEWNGY
jgi:hypothetical protein